MTDDMKWRFALLKERRRAEAYLKEHLIKPVVMQFITESQPTERVMPDEEE